MWYTRWDASFIDNTFVWTSDWWFYISADWDVRVFLNWTWGWSYITWWLDIGWNLTAWNISDAASNSTIVKRTSSWYIKANYFHQSANDTTTSPSHIYVETWSDWYIRPQTKAQFITNMEMVKSDNAIWWVDRVINMVSCTQAEYDALTPVSTTFYIITD